MQKIKNFLKKEPVEAVLGAAVLLLILICTLLFSLIILQSDDYYYSAFWRKGIVEFVRLTISHFQRVNGRAFVHFFAQTALFLPRFLRAVLHSAVVFAIGFLSAKFMGIHKTKKTLFLYLLLFYSAFFILSRSIMREAVMWTSAFYNYVFPAVLSLFALILCQKKHKYMLIICFIAGATTEQWGITAFTMLTVFLYSSLPFRKNFGSIVRHFAPSLAALAGYITIFLSPATMYRLTSLGHTTVSASLIDLKRFGETVFTSSALPIGIFIIISMLPAIVKRGKYSLLFFGLIPLFLAITCKIHSSYTSLLIIFLCYLVLCFALFYKTKSGIFIAGALISFVIMMPSNTFEYRIVFPSVILLVIAALSILFSFKTLFPKKAVLPALTIAVTISLAVFYPTFTGFYQNYKIEKANLIAIKEAQNTHVLRYNIDYDKNYAVKQMFNDGYFFQTFTELYNLDNCKVILVSKNDTPINYKGKDLKVKGYKQKGAVYIPMRAFLAETGGTITAEGNVVMALNGKKLTLSDGIFTFTDNSGKVNYLIADNYKLNNFYTLYINEELCKKAFGY